MYEIAWTGLYVTHWLERLLEPARTEAIAYIFSLHKELDYGLIECLDDSEDNPLLDFIRPELSGREMAEFLSDKKIGDFSLGRQKLLFASKESAEAMSLKIKKIYHHLDLLIETSGRDWLNLEAINPRDSKTLSDYACEMEELLNEYWSIFPRENHKVL